ncbi:MFS transporter [bacterium AH-315-E10]|nr:MFS transporter [bacterium AH-315-E10]
MSEESPQVNRPSKAETRQSLRLFSLNAGFEGVFLTICGSNTLVFIAFALSIGIKREHMGFITALVSMACVLQMLAIPLIGRVKDKKRCILKLAVMEPILFIIAIVLLPWINPKLQILIFGLAVFFAAAFSNITRVFTSEWMASLIPAGIRGRYIGNRMRAISSTTIIAMLSAGVLLDWVGKDNTLGLSIILAGGGLFGLAAVFSLRHATFPKSSAAAAPSIKDLIGTFKTKDFKRCIIVLAIINLPFTFACPYYQVFALEIAEVPEVLIGVMLSLYFIVKAIMSSWLGRQVDRFDPRKTMFIANIIFVLFFILYVICDNTLYWPLFLAWAIVAVADGLYGICITKYLYASVPESKSRAAYFAMYNFIAFGSLGIGGLIAVPILKLLDGVTLTLGPFHLGHFQILFGVCALMMILCSFSAFLLPKKKSKNDPVS